MERRLPATRSNQLRTRRRIGQVKNGIDLLRRKREAMITELLQRAQPALGAREAVRAEATAAYAALLEALPQHGAAGLTTIGWPTREVAVDFALANVWGVSVPTFRDRPALVRTVPARATAPGLVGPAASHAAEHFERLADLLLSAIPEDVAMRRVGTALSRTTRQVNTLERHVTPTLERQHAQIAETLRERERDEQVRQRFLIRRRGAARR